MKDLRRIGRTPLVRARNLEKKLGLKRIFLKLEGNNLCGNRLDRLAILLIKDALAVGKKTLVLAENIQLAKSLAVFSLSYDIDCVFIFPKDTVIEDTEFKNDNVKLIESDGDILKYSDTLAKENSWYNANPNYQNAMLNILALSSMADEVSKKFRKPISNVYVQTSVGYGLSGLHLGFRRLWIEEKLERIPVLHGCTSEIGNSIYKEYIKSNIEALSDNVTTTDTSKYNTNVHSGSVSSLKSAFDAVYDTGGKVKGINDEQLEKYVEIFKEAEKDIELSIENGYSIAGFLRDVDEGKVKNGEHVIVLNDGKINVTIEEEEGEVDVDMVVELLDTWLQEYSDPKVEIVDAVTSASKDGHILFARQNDEIVAIAVVVNTGFDEFIPTYHLAYIAARNGEEGKGIATELLNKVIDVTDGNFSLHVEKDNERAIAVYEKMGLYQAYVRMLYKDEG